jgi:hypothetical protein
MLKVTWKLNRKYDRERLPACAEKKNNPRSILSLVSKAKYKSLSTLAR